MTTRYRRYYEPTNREVEWGLSVRGVGVYEADTGDIDPGGRVFPAYIVALIVRGSGRFWWDRDRSEEIGRGAIIRVAKGVWHRYHPTPGDGWKQYWVVYDGEYADRLYRAGLLGEERSCMHVGSDDTILHSMERLVEISRLALPDTLADLRVELLRVLQRAMRLARAGAIGGRLPAVHVAIDRIRRDWRGRMELGDIAKELNISVSHLRRLFRHETGMSPREYQQSIRINEAKVLLEQSHLSVAETARRVGIDDQYYFSRIFKARTGIPHSKWSGM